MSFLESRLTIPQVPKHRAQKYSKPAFITHGRWCVQAPFSNEQLVEPHHAHGAQVVLECFAPARVVQEHQLNAVMFAMLTYHTSSVRA